MKKPNKDFLATLQCAKELHREGKHDAAKALYLNLIKRHSENPDVLHFYGRLCYQTGSEKKGIKLIKQCLEFSPDYLDALNNLGNMLKLQNDLNGAQDEWCTR